MENKSTEHFDRIIDAMIQMFAADSFWEGTPLARVCRELALERGGPMAEVVRKDDERRMEVAAERAQAKLDQERAEAAENEAFEREAFERLKAKFDSPPA